MEIIRERNPETHEPATGKCDCGEEITLHCNWYGATQCDCGQWYNASGQALNPPEMWEENMDEE